MLKTLQENIDDFINEVESRSTVTDTTEGSTFDTFAGATAFLASEAQRLILDRFAKTFFDSASGPEVTGGPDDLQTLAVDHFGEDFARPQSVEASGVVTFSRPVSTAGDVFIDIGTIVKTKKNASGKEFTYEVTQAGMLTGLTITLPVQATVGGAEYNVTTGAVTVIETALTDPKVTVTNPQPIGGGSDAYTDAQYRDLVRLKITGFRLSVLDSIEAAARTVPGIVYAKGIEKRIPVIEYNIATGQPKVGAKFFRIAFPILYVAGSGGTASAAQIQLVKEAISNVRSWGVSIAIASAVATTLDWTVAVVLNSSGPNYTAFLSADFTLIQDSMEEYLATLPIGTGFDKTLATNFLLNTWGPSGTGDLITLTTTQPGATIAGVEGQKIIAGIMGVG